MSTRIPKQRDIIDRRAVAHALTDLAALTGDAQRARALKLFKDVLASGRIEVQRRFEEDRATGAEVVRYNAFLMDQIVRLLHDFTASYVLKAKSTHLSILAVGGYGRGELSPFSDLDLLFLLPKASDPATEKLVEYMLYMLWDLGLKVGHATRTVDDCLAQARDDMTIRTAMLESRWLWGDKELARILETRFREELIPGTAVDFVEAKLAERDLRHERMGDSRYVLEPNLKEGKGGLRDLHTLFWIARYIYGVSDMGGLVDLGVLTKGAAIRFEKARNFLWTVRCHLHYMTGRQEDRLTFDVQREIGRRMHYTDHAGTKGVERFMRHYFLTAKDVGDLTRVFCAVLEEGHKRKPKFNLALLTSRKKELEGFRVEGGRLNLATPDALEKSPLGLIKLFHTAHAYDLDIHPESLRQVAVHLPKVKRLRDDPEANRLFLELLCARKNPEVALRWLNESGVLGCFLPDFGKVVAQMQYDMYHVYTTDEHTLRAIGILHQIEQGKLVEDHPVSSEIMAQVQSRRALYVALFFHDIAKGRGGDHAELGGEAVEREGPRLGLTPEEVETAAWLVRQHLLMSRIAFKRDIDEPKTIEDFTQVVQSPERLKLLLVLTVADIRAVGPQVWNGWKAGLLRSLYNRALDVLSGNPAGGARDQRVQEAKEKLRLALSPTWSEKEVDAQLALGYPNYWLAFDAAAHQRHAAMIRKAGAAPLTIEARPDKRHSVTEITIYTPDHPGLFCRIAGAMALSGASIVDAKIITLANGMALDVLWVQDAERHEISGADKIAHVKSNLEKTLTGGVRLQQELKKRAPVLPKRADVFTVPPRVLIDNTASRTHTVIEVNGRDRTGFLYDVTAELTRQSLQVSWARISTYGEKVVDVFYVKDIFGMKIEHEGKLKQIRTGLLNVLEGMGG